MQQAYRVIRVVAEAQTVRIALAAAPDALMLRELAFACAAFSAGDGSEVKAVVLDIGALAGDSSREQEPPAPDIVAQAEAAVRSVAPPTLVAARGALTAAATALALAADLVILADTGSLTLPGETGNTGRDREIISAQEAARKQLVTRLASPRAVNGEIERVLELLRDKSALSLRLAKAAVNLVPREHEGQQDEAAARLAALQRINDHYLARISPSADAHEGLRAFLEKREPQWKNR